MKSVFSILCVIVGGVLIFLILAIVSSLVQEIISFLLILVLPIGVLYFIINLFQTKTQTVYREADKTLIEEEFLTLEEFQHRYKLMAGQLYVGVDIGGHVLKVGDKTVATIKKELQGANLQATASKIGAINVCFEIPHEGALDNSGRPSLPCLMESNSQWETIELF